MEPVAHKCLKHESENERGQFHSIGYPMLMTFLEYMERTRARQVVERLTKYMRENGKRKSDQERKLKGSTGSRIIVGILLDAKQVMNSPELYKEAHDQQCTTSHISSY